MPYDLIDESDEVQDSETAEEKAEQSLSFADQVNKLARELTKGEDGTYQLPEGDYSDELRTAVMLEKRRRDTDSAFSKARQREKALEAEVEELRKRLAGSSVARLTAEQKAELEDLKFSDPDAWRVKLAELEESARKQVEEELSQVTDEASTQSEIVRREQILAQFIEENPGFEITDDIIANDIPPRITRKLETGETSFEDFLVEVRDYMAKGKVVKDTAPVKPKPNLGTVGGGKTPDPVAISEDIVLSYRNELY